MSEQQVKSLNGIGGWLILLVFGAFVSIARIGYMLVRDHFSIFRDGTWVLLTDSSSEAYHSLWGPFIIFEIFGNFVSIILAATTLVFLFNRSRHTPKVAIFWLLFGLAFVVADYLLAFQIPAIADVVTSDYETIREVARSVVGALIWVPYFLVSKRVKATFTREWPNNSFKPNPLRGSA